MDYEYEHDFFVNDHLFLLWYYLVDVNVDGCGYEIMWRVITILTTLNNFIYMDFLLFDMSSIMNHRKYLFLMGYPGDEVFSCVLLRRLLLAGKEVIVVFVSSGDAVSKTGVREQEAHRALSVVHLALPKIFFLQVPQREVFSHFTTIINKTRQLVVRYQIDCIVSPDFEGGHEANDSVAFCAAYIASTSGFAYYTFPVYHMRGGKVVGGRFKPLVSETETINILSQEKSVKEGFLAAHQSIKNHFEQLQDSTKDFLPILFSRELYRESPRENFSKKPCEEVMYEKRSTRVGVFEEFRAACEKVKRI